MNEEYKKSIIEYVENGKKHFSQLKQQIEDPLVQTKILDIEILCLDIINHINKEK